MKPESMVQGILEKLKKVDAEYERLVRERESLYVTLALFEREVAKQPSLHTTDKPSTYENDIRSTIYEILSEEQPLHRKDILERVKSKAVPVTAKNPIKLIAYHLSRDNRFKNVARGTWALKTLAELTAESKSLARNGTGGNAVEGVTTRMMEETAD